MKKVCLILVVMLAIGITGYTVAEDEDSGCVVIKDGIIVDVNSDVITTGYDEWGYNYQAHLFNGLYWNYSRPEPPWTKETLIAAGKSTTWLVMKWSDTWLSNKDCNGDGLLDRGYSCNPENPTSSACEGAWETNHQSGWVEMPNGELERWTYFVKIVMVPRGVGNYKEGSYWFTEDGTEIGSVIWGAYARILQISNDPSVGEHGVLYKSSVAPGYGKY